MISHTIVATSVVRTIYGISNLGKILFKNILNKFINIYEK